VRRGGRGKIRKKNRPRNKERKSKMKNVGQRQVGIAGFTRETPKQDEWRS